MSFEVRPDWKTHWRVGGPWTKQGAFQEITFRKVPEVATRVFEPYVSTKRRGSGLGLSLVRDIAAQHHGTIVLEDREGGGARARLALPRLPSNHDEDPTV